MSDGSWKRMFGFVETQHLESLSLNAMLALIPSLTISWISGETLVLRKLLINPSHLEPPEYKCAPKSSSSIRDQGEDKPSLHVELRLMDSNSFSKRDAHQILGKIEWTPHMELSGLFPGYIKLVQRRRHRLCFEGVPHDPVGTDPANSMISVPLFRQIVSHPGLGVQA
ncbi:hypothetical protein T310_9877 [Rasamsonia emersonii CBS 393.64]|uniref:Uncharacterized protein n=1 Tax=Rasamsonia emersonii (strain ATCC 16479 / CBS 393.64 / IMI 116815) TaxID=1408163 RepID=A0A0F4YEX9_RASE3|nr:hypothetical protein T310_9877 [Rasamsonia emersonii CBS 393.64]KKA16531.1 hypothetical protein T310_9877 [Rasamsonia emersonii CBS 393.64]